MSDMLMKSPSDLIQKAEEAITQSNHLLETFTQEWGQISEHPIDDIENIRTLQLVLQYRLDTQTALRQLARLQQHLLQLLGIEPLHSVNFNIERLEYALGSDDLHQILAMLNQLVDALLRILAHQMPQQSLDRKKSLERSKNLKHIDAMIDVKVLQKTFVAHIKELELALEDIAGAPQPGVIYDHISALEGPISRFYQALQHGLSLSASLVQHEPLKPMLQYHLADTLQKTEQALSNLNVHPEHQRLFKPTVANNPTQSLEERACEKRLGHFFH